MTDTSAQPAFLYHKTAEQLARTSFWSSLFFAFLFVGIGLACWRLGVPDIAAYLCFGLAVLIVPIGISDACKKKRIGGSFRIQVDREGLAVEEPGEVHYSVPLGDIQGLLHHKINRQKKDTHKYYLILQSGERLRLKECFQSLSYSSLGYERKIIKALQQVNPALELTFEQSRK